MKKLAAGLLLGAVLLGTLAQSVQAKEAVTFDVCSFHPALGDCHGKIRQ